MEIVENPATPPQEDERTTTVRDLESEIQTNYPTCECQTIDIGSSQQSNMIIVNIKSPTKPNFQHMFPNDHHPSGPGGLDSSFAPPLAQHSLPL